MNSLPFLLLSLVLFVLWCVFFLFSKSTRIEQLTVSVFGFLLAPGMILLVLLNDFRQTLSVSSITMGMEDLLFAFSLSGIASVIYHVLLGKRISKCSYKKHYLHISQTHWIARLVILLALWLGITLLLIMLFPVNSVYAFLVGGLLLGMYIIINRQDLLFDALFSGLFLVFLIFILEQLFFFRFFPDAGLSFWQQQASVSEINVWGIPLEELLWSATVGFALGPLYEYARKVKLNS